MVRRRNPCLQQQRRPAAGLTSRYRSSHSFILATAQSSAPDSEYLVFGIGSRQPRDARQLCRDHMELKGNRSSDCGSLMVPVGRSRGVLFLYVGRSLLDRLGPANAAMLAAGAGILSWIVMAKTAWLPALMAMEPLHGMTLALLHLTCMRLLAEAVPRHLAATALTLYGAVGVGVPAMLLTLASGPLYAHFGARGFWPMAALCAAALPVARALREPANS
jgi:MFS family permease